MGQQLEMALTRRWTASDLIADRLLVPNQTAH